MFSVATHTPAHDFDLNSDVLSTHLTIPDYVKYLLTPQLLYYLL